MASANISSGAGKVARMKTNISGALVKSISWGIGVQPNVCEIALPRERIHDFRKENAGKAVYVELRRNFTSSIIFHGYITGRILEYDPSSENVSLVCLGPRWKLGADFVKGRYIENADGTFRNLDGLKCVFNENVDGAIAPKNGAKEKDANTGIRPFSLDHQNTENVAFTANEMLWYIYRSKTFKGTDFVGGDIVFNEFGVGERGNIVLQDIDVDGMYLGAAMDFVFSRTGLRWWCKPISQTQSELKAFANGPVESDANSFTVGAISKPNKKLKLGTVGTTITLSSNNTNAGRAQEDYAEIANEVFVFGAPKRFQEEFELVPGWDTSVSDSLKAQGVEAIRRETRESSSTNWDKYKDVGRRWILPEFAHKIGEQDKTPADLSTLFGSQEYAQRRRLMLERLDGIQFENIFADTDAVPGDPQPGEFSYSILPDQVGIYIDGDILDEPIFIEKAGASTNIFANSLFIDASIEGDKAVKATKTTAISQDSFQVGAISSAGSTANINRRIVVMAENEYSADNINTEKETDVIAKLQEIADRYHAANKDPRISGSITIPWITTAYEPGDIVNGIHGRNIYFTAQVIEVNFRADKEQATELVLEDFRLSETG